MRGMLEDPFMADCMDMDLSSSNALALVELMAGKVSDIASWLDGGSFSEASTEVQDLVLLQMHALIQLMWYTMVSSDDEGYYPFVDSVMTLAQEYNLGSADFAKDEDVAAMHINPIPPCWGGAALSLSPLLGAGAVCPKAREAILLLSIMLLVPKTRGHSSQWPSWASFLPPLWTAASDWRRHSQSYLSLGWWTCSARRVSLN
jgi:hypothetical protein